MPNPKNPQPSSPPHPGWILKKDHMEPLGISVTDLAAKLGVSRNTLSSIINRRSGVSADMALRLSRALRTEPSFWLALELARELWEAEQLDTGWREVEPLRLQKADQASGRAALKGKPKRLPWDKK